MSYSEICLQYFKVNRNLMTLPLIVVENNSNLEVRDCYLRSMKKETKNYESINQPAINFEVEEIGFWVNGDYLFDYQLNTLEMKHLDKNMAFLGIKSCIFYNFYD